MHCSKIANVNMILQAKCATQNVCRGEARMLPFHITLLTLKFKMVKLGFIASYTCKKGINFDFA